MRKEIWHVFFFSFELNFNGFTVFKRNSQEGAFIYVVCNCVKVENNLKLHTNIFSEKKNSLLFNQIVSQKKKKLGGAACRHQSNGVTVQ